MYAHTHRAPNSQVPALCPSFQDTVDAFGVRMYTDVYVYCGGVCVWKNAREFGCMSCKCGLNMGAYNESIFFLGGMHIHTLSANKEVYKFIQLSGSESGVVDGVGVCNGGC